MSVRNLLILFFSTLAVSGIVLVLFFSLFLKNFDNAVTFDTRLPESAPDIQGAQYSVAGSSALSKAQGLTHATINVPPDFRGSFSAGSAKPETEAAGAVDLSQEEEELDAPAEKKKAAAGAEALPLKTAPVKDAPAKKEPLKAEPIFKEPTPDATIPPVPSGASDSIE